MAGRQAASEAVAECPYVTATRTATTTTMETTVLYWNCANLLATDLCYGLPRLLSILCPQLCVTRLMMRVQETRRGKHLLEENLNLNPRMSLNNSIRVEIYGLLLYNRTNEAINLCCANYGGSLYTPVTHWLAGWPDWWPDKSSSRCWSRIIRFCIDWMGLRKAHLY